MMAKMIPTGYPPGLGGRPVDGDLNATLRDPVSVRYDRSCILAQSRLGQESPLNAGIPRNVVHSVGFLRRVLSVSNAYGFCRIVTPMTPTGWVGAEASPVGEVVTGVWPRAVTMSMPPITLPKIV